MLNSSSMEEYEAYAEVLKAISHPVRLCIVKGLIENGPKNVTNMYSCLGVPQSTISQHISKMKSAGIIKGERNGTEITYSVDNEKIEKLIKCLFDLK
ncbi:helix-turn-helix transcriptional regulator [Peptostreptococcus anaerobius]|uniref:Helix-turn-helix transcriptional regulator n=1 Tax=Peptostreptococcus porci TaxID=2652282 RepID=A0A6N7XA50_9FIRM|nr:metalloregulator ArsR/SmtB family transcription factor [Peptostreptococcus porci]MDD7182277.1 metalloregulator ArsR/SmtB family transcription factor [Peptostreptococcus porci]MDY4128027.1 metalloregulator ArsR/SmtB family transcription factor [Peptostreptococcus porci]MDY5963930.1 metalloregulator ArsR/SmtB family transcription factor [Peptostreptococcus porci]MDY6231184.1 metalloregulator ArsR/SmtB family transcription factor [Peptostreptococcus porci]MST61536.1 helix-turn-helix transcript